MKNNKLWFKRKLYGWGWTSSTWQGWAITIFFVIIILDEALGFKDAVLAKDVYINIAKILAWTVAFVWIAFKTGEKPKWQWGKREDDEK